MDAPRYDEVRLDLIDEPIDPIRSTMDPLGLAELAASIVEIGQLQPLVVIPMEGRYEICAGHRRYKALQIAKMATARCLIFPDKWTAARAAQLQENTEREGLNIVDEALWMQTIAAGFSGDVDRTAQEFKKSRDYVETRLALLTGDPDVLAAIASGAITLGIAKLLNAVLHDGDRLEFLHAAISGGATQRVVAKWIADRLGLRDSMGPGAGAPAGTASEDPPLEERWIPRCFYCEDTEDPHTMLTLQVHKHCLKSLRKVIASKLAGGTS